MGCCFCSIVEDRDIVLSINLFRTSPQSSSTYIVLQETLWQGIHEGIKELGHWTKRPALVWRKISSGTHCSLIIKYNHLKLSSLVSSESTCHTHFQYNRKSLPKNATRRVSPNRVKLQPFSLHQRTSRKIRFFYFMQRKQKSWKGTSDVSR